MARRSKADMQLTRIKLLQSARKSFTEHGYAATSMDELCAMAGLTRGALYHHFGDKQGLFKAVVADLDLAMDLRLKQAYHSADNAWDGFQRRCQLYLEMAQEPEIQRIMIKDARAVCGQGITDSAQPCIDSLNGMLQQLMQDGAIQPTNTEALAVLIHGSLTEAMFWIADAADPSKRLQQALTAFQLLINGIRVFR